MSAEGALLGPGICPACTGKALLNAAAARLVADPTDSLAQVVLGIAARLARTPHGAVPISPPELARDWANPLPLHLQIKLAPRIAAAVGLLASLERQEAEADALLRTLSDTLAQDRAMMNHGQLGDDQGVAAALLEHNAVTCPDQD